MIVAAATALAIWWILVDHRVPNFDSGRHLEVSLNLAEAVKSGRWYEPYTSYWTYPPVLYSIGALSTVVFGKGIAQQVIALDLIFIPLLGLSLYRAGRIVAGRVAGTAAVAALLASPLVISQTHEFMLDLPLAAMTALCVWLLLESKRFSQRGWAIAAGVAIGLGLLTKQPLPIFVAGPILVILVRGGWRYPLNIALCGLAALAIALPWFVLHWNDGVDQMFRGAGAGTATPAANVPDSRPDRWDLRNFAYYGSALINLQLLIPLTLLLLAAVGDGLRRFVRTRDWDYLMPELIAGGIVGWIGITITTYQDPRYTMPCLVYAVLMLGTGIARAPRTVRTIGLAGVVCLWALNTVMVTSHTGPTVRVPLWKPPEEGPGVVNKRQGTLISPEGWLTNRPYTEGRELDILKAARRDGGRYILVEDTSTTNINFARFGWLTLAKIAGLRELPTRNPADLGPRDLFLIRHAQRRGEPPPCSKQIDGAGVYAYRSFPVSYFRARVPPTTGLYCPLRNRR